MNLFKKVYEWFPTLNCGKFPVNYGNFPCRRGKKQEICLHNIKSTVSNLLLS